MLKIQISLKVFFNLFFLIDKIFPEGQQNQIIKRLIHILYYTWSKNFLI